MASQLIIDLHGFVNDDNSFIAKEVALCDVESLDIIFHSIFEPPFNFKWLSPKAQTTNRYCTRHIHNLKWEIGDLPYSSIPDILLRHTQDYDVLLTKGHQKKCFLQNILKRSVTDLDPVISCSISSLPMIVNEPKCTFHHGMGMCAKVNALSLAKYISTNR